MPIFRLIARSALLVLLLPAFAQAQTASTLYRLNTTATFQEGCFDPCLCPLSGEIALRGTFKLGPSTAGNVVDFREVLQANWTVRLGDTLIHTITGAGFYRITNFNNEPQHSLDLDLSIDGAAVQHFFSDFAPVSSNNGRIDLTISLNGLYCYDTVMRVDASPVPRDEIVHYALAAGSSYQVACFDPCDCVSQEPRPMGGQFQLVPLLDFGRYTEYAMVDARFGVPGTSIADAILTLTGFGHYTQIQGFAGPAHATYLSLSLSGGPATGFDQEFENTTALFPRIDIVVDTNDMVCTDTVLTIKARPFAVFGPVDGLRR